MKCESCENEVGKTGQCAECLKKICINCARHYGGHYLCPECLKKHYSHRQYVEKEEAPKSEKAKAKSKPATPDYYKIIPIIIVLIACVFIVYKYNEQILPGPEAEPEPEPEPQFEPILLNRSDLNAYSHMIQYLEVGNYTISCTNGTLSSIHLTLHAGPHNLNLRSVEIGSEIIDGKDISLFSINAGKQQTITLSNIPRYHQISKTNQTSLEILLLADRGIYQKLNFVPDFSQCP